MKKLWTVKAWGTNNISIIIDWFVGHIPYMHVSNTWYMYAMRST